MTESQMAITKALEDSGWVLYPKNGCPEVSRVCLDGKRRFFPCCDTGMRSGGVSHDRRCELLFGGGE